VVALQPRVTGITAVSGSVDNSALKYISCTGLLYFHVKSRYESVVGRSPGGSAHLEFTEPRLLDSASNASSNRRALLSKLK
jgi:hypothetical protein